MAGNNLPPAGGLQKPMTQSRKQKIEAGLTAYQEAEHERDELKRQLDEETARRSALETEHEALRAAFGRQQTEIESYRRDRDHAVAVRADVEAVFNAALMIMQKYRGKTVIDETGAGDAGGGADTGEREVPF